MDAYGWAGIVLIMVQKIQCVFFCDVCYFIWKVRSYFLSYIDWNFCIASFHERQDKFDCLFYKNIRKKNTYFTTCTLKCVNTSLRKKWMHKDMYKTFLFMLHKNIFDQIFFLLSFSFAHLEFLFLVRNMYVF